MYSEYHAEVEELKKLYGEKPPNIQSILLADNFSVIQILGEGRPILKGKSEVTSTCKKELETTSKRAKILSW